MSRHNIHEELSSMMDQGIKPIIRSGKEFALQNSSEVEKFSVDENGNVVAAGGINATGAIDGGAIGGTTGDFSGALSAGGAITSEANVFGANIQTSGNAAITATTGGGTTGLIPANTSFCTVTSDDANKQISLPAGTVGDIIRILVGTTGCELISAVAADKVNEVVVGATNELALTAEALYTCIYTKSGFWNVTGETKLGARIAALVPDAL